MVVQKHNEQKTREREVLKLSLVARQVTWDSIISGLCLNSMHPALV
jgi:hypothetical protein